ncbi:MAG: ribonuclease HII [archaeon]
MLIGGIDEAGRGPCFGPMTITLAVANKEEETELKAIGVKDSKLVLPNKRKSLIEGIKNHILEENTRIIMPLELNDMMVIHSLNEIEAIHIGQLINDAKQIPEIIYVDSPDAKKGAFEKRIRKYLNKDRQQIKIIAENKADTNYTIVGAASIIAKVTRDEQIEKLAEKYGEIGSGYPSDPKTVKYLKDYVAEHKKIPPFARLFWANVQNELKNIGQQKLI